ncbi:MAG TPA: hypothetical protein VMI06_10480, partial [Terriglobia bacterium]|nr:hypothetical protein [Terriglobia bacterium]
KQKNGDRHKPVVILSLIAVILVGIFLIILFFFHGNLHSRSSFTHQGTILASEMVNWAPAPHLR